MELDLPMPVVRVESNPLVEEAHNQVAVMRGPLVYCVEAVDLPADVTMSQVQLPRDCHWSPRHDPALLGGVTVLDTRGQLTPTAENSADLYRATTTGEVRSFPLRLIPYYAWCNRGEDEMKVWLPVR